MQFPNILQEDRLRRFAAAVYPLLCQLWCADLRPEVLMLTNCVIHYDTNAEISKRGFFVIAMFRCAACFAPYFYELELFMAYPTSQMGWIIMERLVSHCHAVCILYVLNSGGECGLLMQKREDN